MLVILPIIGVCDLRVDTGQDLAVDGPNVIDLHERGGSGAEHHR